MKIIFTYDWYKAWYVSARPRRVTNNSEIQDLPYVLLLTFLLSEDSHVYLCHGNTPFN